MKLSKEQERLFETLIFILKITLFSIPMYIILIFHSILLPLQYAVSDSVYNILNIIGYEMTREGIFIFGNGMAFFISEDCTGWKSMLMLLALLFSTPKIHWRKRIIGIAVGVPLIYIGNLIRILIVVFVWGGMGQASANIWHDYLWQMGMAGITIIIWFFWLIWSGKVKNNAFKKLLH